MCVHARLFEPIAELWLCVKSALFSTPITNTNNHILTDNFHCKLSQGSGDLLPMRRVNENVARVAEVGTVVHVAGCHNRMLFGYFVVTFVVERRHRVLVSEEIHCWFGYALRRALKSPALTLHENDRVVSCHDVCRHYRGEGEEGGHEATQ